MPQHIDYFFSVISPWSFIGHAPFMAVVARHGVEVSIRPVSLGPVFAESGGLPLAQRPPQRQRYRLLELQRWRVKRGIDFHIHPAFWPFDPTLADRTIIAAQLAGHDATSLVTDLFAAVWQQQRNLADPDVVAAVADAAGLPGTELVASAQGEAAEAAYADNRDRALASDMFGAPAYVLDGEMFWGQDRIELLDDALASGRAPFRPDSA